MERWPGNSSRSVAHAADWLAATPPAIEAFVATLTGYQVKTVEQKLCALRSFLKFASAEGLIDAAVLDAVPAVRSSKQAGVPSVWDPGEVDRILEAIDRGNPCGKRDYAIVLLIARLGLRSIDVKRLEFGDFDWPGNRLFVTQAKTGDRVQLPLLKDVGWAVIDYIRDGRPVCDCPQVFVRHTAPIGPFSDQDHLHQILVKHARVAHVPISEKRRHGMHSLRHTLGDPVDGGRHAARADRRHSRSSVGSIDGRLPEVVSGAAGQMRAGPRRTGAGGVTVSPEITMADAITALVAEKRAVGYKYAAEERVLARFAAFCCAEFPGLDAPSQASVEAWVAAARQRGVKTGDLAGFGRAGAGSWPVGWDAGACRPTSYPPARCPGPPVTSRTSTPTRNWRACSPKPTAASYCSLVPFRHLVMPVLFRTIYACGLRASEARLLRVADVDIDTGVLQIRAAKGGKDRQTPVSEPLRARLADYHAHVVGRTGGEWFFPGTTGRPLTLGNIDKNFRRFLWQARISHGGRGHGPRVHDLRHTFAVNNLRAWFARGDDVGALLPVLQAYMGHSSPDDTAYYLRLTAESYPHITAQVQRVVGDVVPPVTGGPRHGD